MSCQQEAKLLKMIIDRTKRHVSTYKNHKEKVYTLLTRFSLWSNTVNLQSTTVHLFCSSQRYSWLYPIKWTAFSTLGTRFSRTNKWWKAVAEEEEAQLKSVYTHFKKRAIGEKPPGRHLWLHLKDCREKWNFSGQTNEISRRNRIRKRTSENLRNNMPYFFQDQS